MSLATRRRAVSLPRDPASGAGRPGARGRACAGRAAAHAGGGACGCSLDSAPVSRLTAGGPHYYALRPDGRVGGEVYERMLLEHLPEHGIDLELGLPRDHRGPRPAPAGWRVSVLRHRLGLHWPLAPFAFTPYVIRLLRARRVDLLRGHSVRHTGPALLLGRALARSRVPVVLHHHHLDPRWARLEAAIARRADAVVTVSEHSRRSLVAAGVPASRVHVVLEGIGRPPVTAGWPEPGPAGLRLLQLGRRSSSSGRTWDRTLVALRRAGVEPRPCSPGKAPRPSSPRARRPARALRGPRV